MTVPEHTVDVYVEIGQRRSFAGAVDWPGWCRAGRNEESALEALLEYAPRYARALPADLVHFPIPKGTAAFAIVERLKGDASTDFGAPGGVPSADGRPVDAAELQRFQELLEAQWQTFDAIVRQASGKQLRKGPRGGGRELEAIVRHVIAADTGYLARLGWKLKANEAQDLSQELFQTRQATRSALAAAVRGELPARGPRGGVRWSPRYFIRRVAWHLLDHAWEIEDRVG